MQNEPLEDAEWTADGHLEPTCEPDIYFDEDGLNIENVEQEAAKAVAKFAATCFQVGGISCARKFFQSVHALCFAAQIHPLQCDSMETIAKGLGIGKAGFSKLVNKYRDILKLPRIAGAKSSAARKTYSKKTKATHERRNHNPNPTRTFTRLLGEAHQRAREVD